MFSSALRLLPNGASNDKLGDHALDCSAWLAITPAGLVSAARLAAGSVVASRTLELAVLAAVRAGFSASRPSRLAEFARARRAAVCATRAGG